MELPEEAESLQLLRQYFETGEVDGTDVTTLGRHVSAIHKEHRQGASRVNILLGDVFGLEKQLQAGPLVC